MRWLPFALFCLCGAALAQDRPDEESLFGAPDAGMATTEAGAADAGTRPSEEQLFAPPETPTAGAVQLQPQGSESEQAKRDAERLGLPPITSQFDTGAEKTDPLQIGGMLYLRTFTSILDDDEHFKDLSVSAPSLMDGYLDARPSERVRGFLLARMEYNPTLDPDADQVLPSYTGTGTLSGSNPSVELDQLWLRFDLARTAFITAGKQHVKWGASRFWNPTDFLSPERKDALAVFDQRLGASMLKVHVPWEAKGWNFYAIGLLDNTGPADTLGELGIATRAEVVFGPAELGGEAVFVGGRKPRYGFDLSSALGPVDVYGEIALRRGDEIELVRAEDGLDFNRPLLGQVSITRADGVLVQVSGGVTYLLQYTDKNALTIGAEYFFNEVGLRDPDLYPLLLATGRFVPFYVGRHYAAVYALAAGLPWGLDEVTVVLTNLGNLTDLSFIGRADVFVRILSYLTLEIFGSLHYGNRGGEFRLGFDIPAFTLAPGQPVMGPISVPAPSADFGLGLRLAF